LDYLDRESIREYLLSLERGDNETFAELEVNGFQIRLCAGECTFSFPQSNQYSKLHEYEGVEVYITESLRAIDTVLFPLDDSRFKTLSWAMYFDYFDNQNNLKTSSLGNCVPFEELPDIIRDVYKISRLKLFY